MYLCCKKLSEAKLLLHQIPHDAMPLMMMMTVVSSGDNDDDDDYDDANDEDDDDGCL